MSRFLVLRALFTLALLSGGLTSVVHAAHEEPAVDAELVPSTGDISGAALPASGLVSLATLVELDGRGIRFGTTIQTLRERARVLHAATRSVRTQSAHPFYSDVGARLLRGGIDSSTLGTPPPQS